MARLSLTVRGKSHPWPLPANAGDQQSTWATPENVEGFRGCRSPHPAADHSIHSLLKHGWKRATLTAICGGGLSLLAALAGAAETGSRPPVGPEQNWIEGLVSGFRAAAEGLEWSDERVVGDWRVQRRAGDPAAEGRILDADDRVVCTGDLADCLTRFERLQSQNQIPAITGEAVFVLHGLGENRQAMRPLVEHLQTGLDATVMTFGYASPRAGLAAHAGSLARVLTGLPDVTAVSFVGHSMGNLVVRRWLEMADPQTVTRVRRMVMLGPPNQGSDLARLAAGNSLLTALAAGAGRELVLHWETIAQQLRTPDFEYGIIAGGKGDDRGFTVLLEGDDDAVVRVAETRLEGADDFLVLPVRHSRMMRHPDVQAATLRFLREGRFVEGGEPEE